MVFANMTNYVLDAKSGWISNLTSFLPPSFSPPPAAITPPLTSLCHLVYLLGGCGHDSAQKLLVDLPTIGE